MEAPSIVNTALKSDAFTSFVNNPRKPSIPKLGKSEKGSQTSGELAMFLLNVANLNNEEKSQRVLAAVFRAYRQSPKLKGSALLGRLIRIFANPLLNPSEAYTDIQKDKLNQDDPDKSYKASTRNTAAIACHDTLIAKLQKESELDRPLYFIFFSVIISKDSLERTNILNALLSFLSNNPDQCVERLKACPNYIRKEFKTLSPELLKKITSAELAAALPQAFSAEELLKSLLGHKLEETLTTYVKENDGGKNAVYPPVGQLLIDLIKNMKVASTTEQPIEIAKRLLEVLYLILTDFLDKDKFPRGKTDKFARSELIPALIDGLSPILLNGDALAAFKEAAGKKYIGKRFKVEKRAELLKALQTAIICIYQETQQVLPLRENLGRIVSLVLNEETNATLREALIDALKEYYRCVFKGENGFENSTFADLVLACDDSLARGDLKQLPGVPESIKQAIQTVEIQRVEDGVGKSTKEEEDKQASRDRTGVKSYIHGLKRNSKAAPADPKAPTNASTSSPSLGKKRTDGEK